MSNYCWRALARQHPILYNSEKKARSVGCKIEDMRIRLCFYILAFRAAWMFKCLGWPCPATFIFLLFETPIVTLWSSCAPKHVLWQRVFRSASEFKERNLIEWTGHFAIYVRRHFGWRYISSLHSADELQQERNSFPLLRSCLIGSWHVGVSKRFSRSISLAVFCLYACECAWKYRSIIDYGPAQRCSARNRGPDNLVPRAHVSFGQHQDTCLGADQKASKTLAQNISSKSKTFTVNFFSFPSMSVDDWKSGWATSGVW